MNAYKSRIAVAVAAAGAGLCLTLIPTASAGGQAPFVPAHRHFIVAPDGTQIEVGPQACGNPKMQTAFNEFHANVHVGPANTGFDHEHNPVDIVRTLCP